MTKKIALILISIWWGWTVIIDFAVVPTVFKIINDFFNAGELGIALFSKLNTLEIIFSSLLIVVSAIHLKNSGRGKIQLALAVAAWMIVMFYFSYLTPKIIHLSDLWKEAETVQKMGIAGINDIQQEHQFYHRMYVGLDSLKLLMLTILLGNDVLRKA
jgi:uncharacterized membrane protein YozB (DUF420 family)